MPQSPTSLPGIQVKDLFVFSLLDGFFNFGHDHFDVTWVRHVWVDLRAVNLQLAKV